MSFSIASVRHGGSVYPCLQVNRRFWRLDEIGETYGFVVPRTVAGIFEQWDATLPKLKEIAQLIESGVVSSVHAWNEHDVELDLPIQYPRKVFCVGANYADHLKEMGVKFEKAPGSFPFFFLKPATTALSGPGRSVHLPPGCRDFDWEAEVVVVFGRSGRNVSPDDAMDLVAGYTLGIDFTARDHFTSVNPQLPFRFDFSLGKCQDRSTPVGPWIVPKDFVNGDAIPFRLSVNGTIKQDASTSDMIYSLREQIAGVSRAIGIEAGDLLFTGSPAGVGAPRGESLAIGDRVKIMSDVIGDMEVVIQSPLSK
ncbi:fumarylacetoacetate hydrolase family protein [Caballeronia sp. J97]|uniref:fumarylacetoacetate hydrolase family protein n=1 Tax=Caballeronia sp. J97 TaxID=2805429 RepID=UPI002AB103A1|nr:fumarylacetoacetate hydrolase family protein [Caballeronia sp. J97]